MRKRATRKAAWHVRPNIKRGGSSDTKENVPFDLEFSLGIQAIVVHNVPIVPWSTLRVDRSGARGGHCGYLRHLEHGGAPLGTGIEVEGLQVVFDLFSPHGQRRDRP